MLGFHISVYRLENGTAPAPSYKAPRTERLAVWQTGIGGLDWLDDLVKQGNAVQLCGSGYPTSYTAKVEHVRPKILDEAPHAKTVWASEPGDVLTDKWCGKTTTDHATIARM